MRLPRPRPTTPSITRSSAYTDWSINQRFLSSDSVAQDHRPAGHALRPEVNTTRLAAAQEGLLQAIRRRDTYRLRFTSGSVAEVGIPDEVGALVAKGATWLVERTDQAQWGDKIIQRLANDLRAAFPGTRGFSARNLKYMRSFARVWPDSNAIGQQLAAQLPWGHIMVLLDRFEDQELRDWYADQAINNGWSRAVLEHHVKTRAHLRFGTAPTNFDRILEPGASDLARQITKDPYVFDFLDVEPDYVERDLEQALMDRIVQTLGELGKGFSFVGRQVPFDVDGDEFILDLLFFHVEQLRYVVVELKTGRFKPEFVSQLGF